MNTTATKKPERDLASMKELLSKQSGDVTWNCSKCAQILGVVASDRSSVRIKYKDLFLFIEGGNVTTICRKCGYPNSLIDTSSTPSEVPETPEAPKVETEKMQT